MSCKEVLYTSTSCDWRVTNLLCKANCFPVCSREEHTDSAYCTESCYLAPDYIA